MRAQKDEGEEEALLTETTVFSAQRPPIGKMDRSRKMPKTVAPTAAHYQHALWPITTALAVLLLVSRDQQMALAAATASMDAQQNPLLIQADPNFLRFGRSPSTEGDELVGGDHWKRVPNSPSASANFLRFGKSVPVEPNFLRFGRGPLRASAAYYWLNGGPKSVMQQQHQGVDPSFLRFGRRVGGSSSNFLRFGRNFEEPVPLGYIAVMDGADGGAAVGGSRFERDNRQPNPNFLRFG